MKLHQLIDLMDPNTPVCLEYRMEIYKYDHAATLMEDYMFYEEVRELKIEAIWHSRYLYHCIVVKLELY